MPSIIDFFLEVFVSILSIFLSNGLVSNHFMCNELLIVQWSDHKLSYSCQNQLSYSCQMIALTSLQVTGGSPQGPKVVGLELGDLDGPTEDPDDAAQKSCCGAHPVGRLIFFAPPHFLSPASPNLDTHRLSCKNDAGDNSSPLGSRPPAVMLNDEEPSIFFPAEGERGGIHQRTIRAPL